MNTIFIKSRSRSITEINLRWKHLVCGYFFFFKDLTSNEDPNVQFDIL